jgi:hypothetical protein
VRKGEKGLVVLAPIPIKRGEDGEEPDEVRVGFRSAFVFADSQPDPLLEGASRCCRLLPPLTKTARRAMVHI